jgi:hypothetical protein
VAAQHRAADVPPEANSDGSVTYFGPGGYEIGFDPEPEDDGRSRPRPTSKAILAGAGGGPHAHPQGHHHQPPRGTTISPKLEYGDQANKPNLPTKVWDFENAKTDPDGT